MFLSIHKYYTDTSDPSEKRKQKDQSDDDDDEGSEDDAMIQLDAENDLLDGSKTMKSNSEIQFHPLFTNRLETWEEKDRLLVSGMYCCAFCGHVEVGGLCPSHSNFSHLPPLPSFPPRTTPYGHGYSTNGFQGLRETKPSSS